MEFDRSDLCTGVLIPACVALWVWGRGWQARAVQILEDRVRSQQDQIARLERAAWARAKADRILKPSADHQDEDEDR